MEGSYVLKTPASEHTANMCACFICFSGMFAAQRTREVQRCAGVHGGWGPVCAAMKERLLSGTCFPCAKRCRAASFVLACFGHCAFAVNLRGGVAAGSFMFMLPVTSWQTALGKAAL